MRRRRPSSSSIDAFDNAMIESFFATLEKELLHRRCLKTQAEAKLVRKPSAFVRQATDVCAGRCNRP
jgi:hypothetical protein